ncbi:biotin transporter BioY [Myxococcus sp. MxC21-1]|uniref:biotin transporter BioY n=1 Tax=Myxococcus sp. MxC21-1 TaxID=3041439 RepID=UPI00293121A9|nr:biotin transporter BioY [Myxococcus sp. MxC21-1]WNZ64263.1 biotin transporter BioY [Myxococcus sp. MxC21-1]
MSSRCPILEAPPDARRHCPPPPPRARRYARAFPGPRRGARARRRAAHRGLAQVSISVPGSPVPITGQSLGVIVAAAALGPVRGMAAQLLYLLMGAVGLPFFAEGASGLERILGATGGYLVGFVPAAFLVGLAAQRGFDRRPWTALPLFAVGQLAVFAVGLPWLVLSARLGVAKAVGVGFTPFLPGGLLKAAIAAVLLPLAWRMVGPRKV